MKHVLLILTICCFLGVVGSWLATGAHWGWTATQVAVPKTDPITEIEFVEWEPRLVLGIDFLAFGLIGCLVLGGITFWVSRKR